MVVVDATVLLLLFDPSITGPVDANGEPLRYAKQRVEYFIAELEKSGEKIIVPTPVLGELLVRRGASEGPKIVEKLNGSPVFIVESFDQRAAIELAVMLRERPEGQATHAKMKFDRQIVAIAKVCGASAIYSDDDDIHTLASRAKIQAYRVRDLPLPPDSGQGELFKPAEGPEVASMGEELDESPKEE